MADKNSYKSKSMSELSLLHEVSESGSAFFFSNISLLHLVRTAIFFCFYFFVLSVAFASFFSHIHLLIFYHIFFQVI